jgi:septation ring formation regulator EzrA
MTEAQFWASLSVIISMFLAFILSVKGDIRETRKATQRNALTLEGQKHHFLRIEERFDAVDQRFDAVDQRFDAVDQRFDKIEATLAEHSTHLAELRTRGDAVAEQIYSLGKRLDEHLRWHAS